MNSTAPANQDAALVTTGAVNGLQLNRRHGSGSCAVLVLGAVGVVAAGVTAWSAARSPILVASGSTALWRAAIVASYWAVGTYTWWRRPDSRLGPVVLGVGFLYAATSLAGSAGPVVHTLGMVVWTASVVGTAYMYLCFPSGRLQSRLERLFMLAFALGATVLWALILALSPNVPSGGSFVNCGARCPPNALQLVSRHAATGAPLVTAFHASFAMWSVAVAILICTKARSSARLRRRAFAPLAVASTANVAAFGIALILAPHDPGVNGTLRVAMALLLIAIPFTILIGQIRGHVFAAISLGQVAARANGKPLTPAAVQELLGEALGDATLRLAVWAPERDGYVDVEGAPLTLPTDPARGITWVKRNGRPIAALVHDPALDTDVNVVEGLAATSLMLLENARLVEELRASRARIVETGERERRRLERDLHDGAQQRLVTLQVQLERALELADDEDQIRRLNAAQQDAGAALGEIRALAHGIYPAELHDLGLASALRSLARRSPVPIRVTDEGIRRAPPAIEAAIYFCAREAIQNATKHAGAGATVTVRLGRRADAIEFTVSDDGVGITGQRDPDGVGITGMRDRIEAAGGEFEVDSGFERGTSIRGRIPLIHDQPDRNGKVAERGAGGQLHPPVVTSPRGGGVALAATRM